MSVDGLNAAQRSAVMTRSGPLLVLAGAGTGKTRVITFRISELIRHGVSPERILAVTFTNKAAREMRERALTLLGKRRRKTPEVSTFHSLCVRILRRHIARLGYPATFAIYDQSDQESVARAVLRDLRVGNEKLRPGDLLAIIGGWKNRALGPDEAEKVASNDREQLAALAYGRYQSAIKASGAVDFDDLLLCTEELFRTFKDVRRAEADRFDHLLIDEYQDTNSIQYRIVKALAERHRNLCVVGDDDQSIYGWRGAEVTHILSFAQDWPGAKIVRLEENYRSIQPVLDLANTLIAHNTERHAKVLHAQRRGGEPPKILRYEDETTEATEIVRVIQQRTTAEPPHRESANDFAILFRTNEQPRVFETELRRAKVPYVLIGGQSFFDRKEVRDVLAYLKVLANPADEQSLLRILNTPKRGIGDGVVQTLVAEAVRRGCPLWSVLPDALQSGDVPHYAGERVDQFRRMLDEYRGRAQTESLVTIAKDLLGRIDYRAELDRIYKNPGDAEARWESVSELINALAVYESRSKKPTLREFLDETALSGREDQRDEKERRSAAVTLMTLHSAKGLEFPHVFMVGMEEGLLPHRRTIEEGGGRAIAEERRLCYVGVTRARDSLALSFCKARMKWGALRAQIPSRFLMEMRGETEKARRAAEAAEKLFAKDQDADEPAEPKKAKTARSSSRGQSTRAKNPKPRRQSVSRNSPSTRSSH